MSRARIGRLAATALALSAAFLLTGRVEAVKTAYWTEDNARAFTTGTKSDVVLSNKGVIRLARQVKSLLPESEVADVAFVNAVAEDPAGNLFVATGPKGIIYKVAGDGKAERWATLTEHPMPFSISVGPAGDVFVGTGGRNAVILRLNADGRPTAVYGGKDVKYYWAMAWDESDHLYAAVGTPAQVLRFSPDGTVAVAAESKKDKNFISLVYDRKSGNLYAGTDTNGLIYRIDVRGGKGAFVLHDAVENEISALAVDDAGNVLAATADSRAGRSMMLIPPMPPPDGGGPGGPGGPGMGRIAPPQNDPEAIFAGGDGVLGPVGTAVNTPAPRRPGPAGFDAFEALFGAKFRAAAGARPGSSARPLRSNDLPEVDDDPPGEIMPMKIVLPKVAPPARRAEHRQAGPDVPGPGPGSGGYSGERPGSGGTGSGGPAGMGGNAVYRISAGGFVETLLRLNNIMFLSMGRNGNQLILGTAADGRVVHLDAVTGEYQQLLRLDKSTQVTVVHVSARGRAYLGSSNNGRLSRLEFGYIGRGEHVSQVYDARLISRWGRVSWEAVVPPGTKVSVATRSGNVSDPAEGTWSAWSPALTDGGGSPIASPTARFLQYKLILETADGAATPEVNKVRIAYVSENQPPRVRDITHSWTPAGGDSGRSYGGDAGRAPQLPLAMTVLTVRWSAEDPNSDTLSFNVYFREVGDQEWTLLEGNTRSQQARWDTTTVRDGHYQIKVEASDSPDNPGNAKAAHLVGDSITVDNTRPEVTIDVVPAGGGSVEVTVRARDALTNISAAAYSLDSNSEFTNMLPADGIFDSADETFRFKLTGLKAGEHRLAVRVWDAQNNLGNGKKTIRIAN